MIHAGPPATRELDLNITFSNPLSNKLFRLFRRPLESILCLQALRDAYRRCAGAESGALFLEKALLEFGITREIGEGDIKNIPPVGPVILVSNHPFGVLDPMAVLSTVLAVRADAMVMGNNLLWRIPEMRDILVPVNPFGGTAATRENVKSVRQCLRILKQGRLLCMFPAGTVSHIHLRGGHIAITDPPWNTMAARLVRATGAMILPAHVSGRNSALFQIAGLGHPILRTALLPRETVQKIRAHVRVRIGKPIPCEYLDRFSSDEERIQYLRSRSYLLSGDNRTRLSPFRKKPREALLKPLAAGGPRGMILREIEALPLEQFVVEMSPFRVFQASAGQIPVLLQEIARLRESTFRQEGEGTGKPLDTDRFDAHYRHLVLWDEHKREIAGAYRMGLSEEILPSFGTKGFYTHTLFHFSRCFFDRIAPAIELGRSFVTPDYQKSYQPLFLLWKGVGRFVSDHPEYKNLFGPVSITRAYNNQSRQLMAAFLKENRQVTELARLVRARKPFRKGPGKNAEIRKAMDPVRDMRELSELVSELEHDRKGVPVLIRQYLRLGGVVLGFNVDRNFRDVLDALVLVDLTRTPPRALAKYMGRDEARAFLHFHESSGTVRCA